MNRMLSSSILSATAAASSSARQLVHRSSILRSTREFVLAGGEKRGVGWRGNDVVAVTAAAETTTTAASARGFSTNNNNNSSSSLNLPRITERRLNETGRGGRASDAGLKVAVFGATGFLGRYVCSGLGE